MDHVLLGHRFAVDRDDFVVDFHRVAGQADHALHEVGLGLERIAEDDDVAAADLAQRQQPAEGRARVRR